MLEMFSPEVQLDVEEAAKNGSAMYSGSMGDSAGRASSRKCLAKMFLPFNIWKSPTGGGISRILHVEELRNGDITYGRPSIVPEK
jgi:hypothetical protein